MTLPCLQEWRFHKLSRDLYQHLIPLKAGKFLLVPRQNFPPCNLYLFCLFLLLRTAQKSVLCLLCTSPVCSLKQPLDSLLILFIFRLNKHSPVSFSLYLLSSSRLVLQETHSIMSMYTTYIPNRVQSPKKSFTSSYQRARITSPNLLATLARTAVDVVDLQDAVLTWSCCPLEPLGRFLQSFFEASWCSACPAARSVSGSGIYTCLC